MFCKAGLIKSIVLASHDSGEGGGEGEMDLCHNLNSPS